MEKSKKREPQGNQEQAVEQETNVVEAPQNDQVRIKWSNIVVFLGIIFGVFFIGPWVYDFITQFIADFRESLDMISGDGTGRRNMGSDSEAFELAKICAVFIFVWGLVKFYLDKK